MYNFHGHPWAKILNTKLESKKSFKTRFQNIRRKIFGEEFKEEKYFNEFFKQINKKKQVK
jgi:hypothetical protein